jgi:hypothetical protein
MMGIDVRTPSRRYRKTAGVEPDNVRPLMIQLVEKM